MFIDRFLIGLGFLVVALSAGSILGAEEMPNLVPNAGFERGEGDAPEEWKFSSWKDSAGTWDQAFAYRGSKSLKMTGHNGGWGVSVPVTPGMVHGLTFRYRAEGGPGRIVAYVRDLEATAEERVLLYYPAPAVLASDRGGFVAGEDRPAADEKGWVLFDAGSFLPREGVRSVNLLIKLTSEHADAKLWLDDVRMTISQSQGAGLSDPARVLKRLPGASVWFEDEHRKILPDRAPPETETQDGVSLDLAQGEYGSFQVAVSPQTDWRRVTWSWDDWTGPGILDASRLRCRLVEMIPIEAPNGPFGHRGLNPDPLTDRIPCEIRGGVNQSFWFTVFVPIGQAPGRYETSLILSSIDGEAARIPLDLRVRGFALPRRPTIDVYSGFRASLVRKAEAGDTGDVMKRYYRSFFEHRTRCAPGVSVGVKLEGRRAEVDASAFIEQLRFMRDEFGSRPFFLPSLWISHRGTHRMPADAKWKGRSVFADPELTRLDPDFEEPFLDFMGQLAGLLKEEHLFQEPIVRFIDEPNLDDPVTVTGIRTLAEMIRRIDPAISVSLTTTRPHPDLLSVIQSWTLHTDAWDRNLASIEAARRAGCRISVYNNAVNYPEHEPIRTRLWPWLLKKYGVDGSNSWWGTVSWQNEMEHPWTCGKGGSGVMLYPPRDAGESGPIESVRWELFRQGLQDYEYLHLAEQLAEQLEQAGKPLAAKAGRSALASALALVEKWPRVRPANDQPYNRDVTALAAARLGLADAIEFMLDARESESGDRAYQP